MSFRIHVCLMITFVLAALLIAPGHAIFAQEGHPLAGTWYGEWGPTAKRIQITVVMSWDGKNITGMINPGPDAMTVKAATLDSTKWAVHIEADGKDDKGQPVHFVADGKLENVGSHNRTITGTWNSGATKSDFKLRRDD